MTKVIEKLWRLPIREQFGDGGGGGGGGNHDKHQIRYPVSVVVGVTTINIRQGIPCFRQGDGIHRFFRNVQNGSGANPACYLIGTGGKATGTWGSPFTSIQYCCWPATLFLTTYLRILTFLIHPSFVSKFSFTFDVKSSNKRNALTNYKDIPTDITDGWTQKTSQQSQTVYILDN